MVLEEMAAILRECSFSSYGGNCPMWNEWSSLPQPLPSLPYQAGCSCHLSSKAAICSPSAGGLGFCPPPWIVGKDREAGWGGGRLKPKTMGRQGRRSRNHHCHPPYTSIWGRWAESAGEAVHEPLEHPSNSCVRQAGGCRDSCTTGRRYRIAGVASEWWQGGWDTIPQVS